MLLQGTFSLRDWSLHGKTLGLELACSLHLKNHAVLKCHQTGLQVCCVAHSYGTFVASRMAQLYPASIQSLALLDPVNLGVFMPHLVQNFIYR